MNEQEYFSMRRMLYDLDHCHSDNCCDGQYDLETQLALHDAVNFSDRRGDWFPTYSGKRFYLLDPRPEDICIEDIAQGLSRISRYNGATKGKWGYTVAHHSVLCSLLVQHARLNELPFAPTPPQSHCLHALLHDAPEAYIGDLVTPLKQLLGKLYEEFEYRVMSCIASRFGFSMTSHSKLDVKHVDRRMLVTEVQQLFPAGFVNVNVGVAPFSGMTIEPWEPEVAKERFLQRFYELCPQEK